MSGCLQAFVMETFKAVANGNAGRVHELIQSGVSVQCTSGTPPHDSLLHWACYYGNDEVSFDYDSSPSDVKKLLCATYLRNHYTGGGCAY